MKTLILSISLLFLVNLNAQNSVKNSTVVSNCSSCTGTYTWNTTSAFTPSVMIAGPGFVRDLQATNFGFNIPLTASITGIQVQFFHSSSFPHPTALVDTVVSLLKGGVVSGVNKNNLTPAYNSTTATMVNLGGMSDVWGTSWTPTDINAANFGFNFKLYLYNVGNVDLRISQGFIITVYYSTSTGLIESQTKNGAMSFVSLKNNEMTFLDFEKLENPSVHIYDLTGKQVAKINPIETPQIDLSLLNAGIYFYQINSVQLNLKKKFLITK